jgi:NADH dehydrogenase
MRTGPIVITGASGHVGTALCRRLERDPNEVRPLGRGDDLAAAMRDAVAVVHLAGTLAPVKGDTYDSANLDTARAVVGAVAGSGVQRIVDLSYVDADPASANAYRRAKGQAEQVLAGAGVELLTLRAPWIFGPPQDPGPSFAPFLARDGKPVTVIGGGGQRMAPVYVEDVAEALARGALDPTAPTGTFALAGPQELTLDEMVALLDGAGVRERHIPPSVARLLAHLSPQLNPTLVEVLLADSLPHDPPAAEALGLELRAPRDVYAA